MCIRDSKGYLIAWNINNVSHIQIFDNDRKLLREEKVPAQITGFEYEVRAAMEAIRDGKMESPQMPHSETLYMMRLMDEMCIRDRVSHDSLLPLADHIALAAKRAEEKMQIPNPFTPDIKVLFEKEYKVALKGREIIREMTGAEISDDEVGFISLHIHSARSDEKVSETLDNTRLINEGLRMIEEYFQIDLEQDS